VCQFSDLLQNTLGFVAGCAWTDVVTWFFPSIGADPTLAVTLTNFAVGVLLMLGGVAWLVLTGNKSGLDAEEAADRSAVERYFVTNSMCFFVGWTWNIVMRDVFMPFGVGVEQALLYLEATFGFSLPVGIGETVTVVIFIPLATAIILKATHDFEKRYVTVNEVTPPVPEPSTKELKKELTMKPTRLE